MTSENKKKQLAVKEEQKKVTKTDGTYSFSNFAGDVSALSEWINVGIGGATQLTNLYNQIDSVLADLAKLDLDGNCKGTTPSVKDTDGDFGEFGEAASRCNPFKNLPAFKDKKNGEEVKASEVVATIIKIIEKLLGPSNFPGCVAEQYKNFLSVVPVQYYLLNLLKIAADKLEDPVKQLEGIAVCKDQDVASQIQNLDDAMPDNFIRTLPRLPYIPIPDLIQLVVNLILEFVCFGLCASLTPLIEKVGEAMLVEFGEEDKKSLALQPNQSLQKISIEPFLNDDVLAEIKSFVDKNIPDSQNITKENIKEYIIKVQADASLSQEEFVFLLFGKIDCKVYDNVTKIEETLSIFDLDTEQKVTTFFSFVGSSINLFGFVKDSKSEVCPPDPCELKDEQLVVAGIANLCDLLSPQAPINIPVDSLLDAVGAFDFIAEALEKTFNAIATFSGVYNPQFDFSDPKSGDKSYISVYNTIFNNFNIQKVLPAYIKTVENPEPLLLDQVIPMVLVEYRQFYYSNVFAFADVREGFDMIKKDYTLLASSKDFTVDGIPRPGLANESKVKFNVYNKFSKDDIRKTMKQISQQSPTNADETEADMINFQQLKQKYNIGVE